MKVEDVERLLMSHGRQVEKLETGTAADFLKQIEAARDRLIGRIAALTPDDGFDPVRLRTALSEAEFLIGELQRKLQGLTLPAIGNAAKLAVEHTASEIVAFAKAFEDGGGMVKPMLGSVDVLRVLGTKERALLANQFDTSIAKWGLDSLATVQRELFGAMQAGDQQREIVKRMTGPQGPFSEVAKSDMARIVRTETSSAYGITQKRAIKAHDDEEIKQAEADGREPRKMEKMWWKPSTYNCVRVCNALHKTDRPIDGTWKVPAKGGTTREIQGAPAHPNCACRIIPMRKSWKDKLDELGY